MGTDTDITYKSSKHVHSAVLGPGCRGVGGGCRVMGYWDALEWERVVTQRKSKKNVAMCYECWTENIQTLVAALSDMMIYETELSLKLEKPYWYRR